MDEKEMQKLLKLIEEHTSRLDNLGISSNNELEHLKIIAKQSIITNKLLYRLVELQGNTNLMLNEMRLYRK